MINLLNSLTNKFMPTQAQEKFKQNSLKQNAAQAALNYMQEQLNNKTVIGIGTGTTVNSFIDLLDHKKYKFHAVVASSKASAAKLRKLHFDPVEPNQVSKIDLYIDGMDEINAHKQMIKGGGGALTGEKLLASMADEFIAIGDDSKLVDCLGNFPIALEVIPIARSFVAREIVKLGGDPVYRAGFITDYGNMILDVYNLQISLAEQLENDLNQIPGLVTNGIFAKRRADKVFISSVDGTQAF